MKSNKHVVSRGNRTVLSPVIHVMSGFKDRLGGVVVSVLATGPKARGSEPGQGSGFKDQKNQ
jgi:hypothetical protein